MYIIDYTFRDTNKITLCQPKLGKLYFFKRTVPFQPIAIEMRPVTRDVIIYMFNVSILVMIVWDGQVDWYEAVILAVLYILYFVFMFNSMRLFGLYDKLVGKCCNRNGFESKFDRLNYYLVAPK